MRDPFETAKIADMFRTRHVPVWEAALRDGVAADLAAIPVGPDSERQSENGVAHAEVAVHMLARIGDVEAIAGAVIENMRHRIQLIAHGAGRGLIYWRTRPYMSVTTAFTNKRYHAGGAHYDALTDQQFDGDGEWYSISAYARLSRSEPANCRSGRPPGHYRYFCVGFS